MDLMPKRLRYRWLRLRPGAHWPAGPAGRDLLRRLNNAGRQIQLQLLLTSGYRYPREQWEAYQDYLRGGTLAAPCCALHYPHSWAECQRDCCSRHCQNRACDVVVVLKEGQGSVNVGEYPPARKALRGHGLCLPVGQGETWHVEVGETWLS